MAVMALFLLISLGGSSCAQEPVKEWQYLNPNNSTCSNYLVVRPAEAKPKALLVLLAGFNGLPTHSDASSSLPEQAAQRNWLCILPTLATGIQHLGSDSMSLLSLERIIQHAQATYGLSEASCYVGGFSVGGTAALRYAQWQKVRGRVIPQAVFGIDPPLDWERFYQASARLVRLSPKENPPAEARYMLERLSTELGGTPDTYPEAYWNYSVYAFRDSSQRGVRLLREIPLRLYTEPAINWWIQERDSDLYGMNALDASCLINELRYLGNEQASLVMSERKVIAQMGSGIRIPGVL